MTAPRTSYTARDRDLRKAADLRYQAHDAERRADTGANNAAHYRHRASVLHAQADELLARHGVVKG